MQDSNGFVSIKLYYFINISTVNYQLINRYSNKQSGLFTCIFIHQRMVARQKR